MMTRRTWNLLVTVVAVLVLLTGLIVAGVLATRDGTAEDVAVPADRPTTAPTTAAPEPERAPLTGLVVEEGVDLDHPAVAVKVSDVRQAYPQVGVDRADIVFVEPIGVSYSRLAAVFHSDLPDLVGPVRSVRPMDAPLLGPLGAVFANTMGAQWVMDYVDSVANLDSLGTSRVTGSGAYVIDGARPAPDHVFVKPAGLLELSGFADPPEPYFGYAAEPADSSAAVAGAAGARAVVQYGPDWNVTWSYDEAADHYLRDQPFGPHTMADGTRIGAVNVLVLHVASSIGKIGEGSGAPVPILHLVDSSGRFTALSGGHSVTGTWSKADVNEPFELVTDAGAELLLAPGNTWVELPAPAAAVTTE
jgi:hypothetical protein